VSGSWDATAKVWEVGTGREIASFAGHTLGYGLDIAFSPDGKTVFSSGADSYGRQWDAAIGQQVAEYYADGREIYGLAVSPDGRLLALGLHDGEINVWDTIQNIKVLTLTGHAGINARLAFSQDGARLASANFDGLAKVWDVQSGQELFSLYGNPSNVFGVDISPDGSRLATAGGDGTLRIFTMDMNELVALARSRLTRTLTESECQKYLHLEQCPVEP
jgi:WD40 repeat protein